MALRRVPATSRAPFAATVRPSGAPRALLMSNSPVDIPNHAVQRLPGTQTGEHAGTQVYNLGVSLRGSTYIQRALEVDADIIFIGLL